MATGDHDLTGLPAVVLLRPRLSAEDLIALNDEIAGMARAGLPLDQGLAALARDLRRGRLRHATEELAADLRAGRSLPEAVERQGGRLPPYYAAVLGAGVRAGRLADVLATLTAYARSRAELRAAVIGALLYPGLVCVLAMMVLLALGLFLIPHFERTFQEMRVPLPALSDWAFTVCRFRFIYVVLPLSLVLAIPVADALLHRARLAAFTDLLALLVEQAVPLPEAFRLAGATSGDRRTRAACSLVEEDLRRGVPLVDALRSRKALPDAATWMLGVGERRGQLAAALRQVADLYRRQAELRARRLRTALPPLLIILVALFIVVLVVPAIFLPLFRLLESLGMRL